MVVPGNPMATIGPDVAGLVNEIPAKDGSKGCPVCHERCPDAARVHQTKSSQFIWKVNGTFSLPTTWTIDYVGLPGDQPSPITGIPSDPHPLLYPHRAHQLHQIHDHPGNRPAMVNRYCDHDADRSIQLFASNLKIRIFAKK